MGEHTDIADRLEACFESILTGRMADVPVLNKALSVKVIGERTWNEHWLGILVTPWFMNVMLVSEADEVETPIPGTKRHFVFPAGRFEFIAGFEEAIGPYWMCSLFSPMFEFADQATAEATAAAALDALFETDGQTDESEQAIAQMWRGEIPETDNGKTVDESKTVDEVEDSCGESREESAPREVSRRAFLTGGSRGSVHES